ncbi:MAG TPA: hypothetical protein VEW28_10640 [Candidatus Kapabacteria bacterium]|nr:hypothetical protein [Candidatus Kapabacteria bacterium]HYM34489.1 hypothetical protein [Steroidobacteraceae bacterium]
MTPLYLRYRNSTSDPWITVPSLTSSYPLQPAGSVPLATMSFATEPALVTPCGCSATGSLTDDHYILHAGLYALPQSAMPALANFLLNYKQATYHEAMHSLFGSGGFVSSELTLLEIQNTNGNSTIDFRLAAAITDVI